MDFPASSAFCATANQPGRGLVPPALKSSLLGIRSLAGEVGWVSFIPPRLPCNKAPPRTKNTRPKPQAKPLGTRKANNINNINNTTRISTAMKLIYTSLVMSLLSYRCLSASVDMWSAPLSTRSVPRNEPIDPEELKARLGTTPAEYKPDERHAGMVYFCRDENWGPPCFTYYPDLEYTCSELGPELAGHVGSVFVEPGAICRMSGLSSDNRCAATKIFAWPETQSGWADLLHEQTPGGEGILGRDTTHFTCAQCTNCIRE